MIKKILKIIAIVIIAGLIVIQFFRIDKSSQPVVQAETLDSAVAVPENVRGILDRSCNDCHSNKTVYPWYSNIQPVGWFLNDHITHGRSHLNFSIFNTYDVKRKVKKLEEVCEQVESKEMPLPSYLWIHRDSVMNEGDARILCDWSKSESAKLSP